MKQLLICLSTMIIVMSCKALKQVVIKDEIEIYIPTKFIKLSPIELKEKYKTSPYQPNLEYINLKDSTIIIISYDSNPLSENGIEELRKNYVQRFKELYPKAIWINTETKKYNSLTVANIETVDNSNYQMIFFTSLNEKQIHFGIQGDKNNIKAIQPIARKILNSIKKKK